MALDGNALGDSIYNSMLTDRYAGGGDLSTAAKDELRDQCRLIANEVLDHIMANAEVTVASGIPVSTTGTASAQTGSTTATGTGTIS